MEIRARQTTGFAKRNPWISEGVEGGSMRIFQNLWQSSEAEEEQPSLQCVGLVTVTETSREVALSSGKWASENISGEDSEEGVSGPFSLPSSKSRRPDPDTDGRPLLLLVLPVGKGLYVCGKWRAKEPTDKVIIKS